MLLYEEKDNKTSFAKAEFYEGDNKCDNKVIQFSKLYLNKLWN